MLLKSNKSFARKNCAFSNLNQLYIIFQLLVYIFKPEIKMIFGFCRFQNQIQKQEMDFVETNYIRIQLNSTINSCVKFILFCSFIKHFCKRKPSEIVGFSFRLFLSEILEFTKKNLNNCQIRIAFVERNFRFKLVTKY